MKRFGTKRGSALLIVLGMMAFIVVSAVAFSAYMRYSRMPSSYLRRTSSSRLLVKAALAEAIDAVDAAIGNNPYPGVGESPARGQMRNVWRNRVFVGTTGSAGTGSTVSTLSMEGLAYIPPAFINEVRYQSRRTPTATWQTLNYDAGRFAYCAVDVSDCLDINRIIAGSARNSSDEGRVTLAYCFENTSHTDYTMDPEEWDNFMEKYDDGSKSKVPLVSVADLNLAIGQDQPGGRYALDLSPFCKYLQQPNNAKFVVDNTDGSATVELQRNLAFVTDSYFAPTNRMSDAIDLSREQDQPFYGLKGGKFSSEDNTKNDDTADQILTLKNRFRTKYEVMPPELLQLYDYLDRDSVPISLAMPTAERTPMVTGISIEGRLKFTVPAARKGDVQLNQGAAGSGGSSEFLRVQVADLKLLADALAVRAGFVYPFKYSHGTTPTFRAQAAATITLVPQGSEKLLRRNNAKAPAVFDRGSWSTSKKNPTAEKYDSEATPVVITMQSDLKPLNVRQNVKTEEDALLEDVPFVFGPVNVSLVGDIEVPAGSSLNGVNVPDDLKKGTFRLVQRMTKDPTTGAETPVGQPEFSTSLRPSNADLNGVVEMADGVLYVPVVQVWVRIIDANDKVVDLVPAYYKDDETESRLLPSAFRSTRECPVLRCFHEGNAEDIAIKKSADMFSYGDSKELTLYPKAYVADDPRFNHAPENLIARKASEVTGNFKDTWLEMTRSENRDGDIFMMTSDAGYLQSVYELTALLDICGMDGSGDISVVDSTAYNGEIRTDRDKLPGGDAMWRTYSQFKTADEAGGDITRNFDVINGSRGFRVNPFTQSENIMMAALANTPLDWWAASTNVLNDAGKKEFAGDTVRGRMTTDLDAAAKYTFSEFSGAQMKFRHGTRRNPAGTLMQVAKNMMSEFSSAGGNWASAFDCEGNWNSNTGVMGVNLGVTLHSVDKKFLHGFWRECFANRQHLFLIFVRAEPMMMGGGSLGQTPPQLGARAVALVWRDPTPNVKYPNGPHRTRVLFYRQFD